MRIFIIIIIICTLYQTLNSSGSRGAYRYKMISQEHTYHTHRELQTISNASMLARHTTLWGTLSSSAQFTRGITPKLLTIESLAHMLEVLNNPTLIWSVYRFHLLTVQTTFGWLYSKLSVQSLTKTQQPHHLWNLGRICKMLRYKQAYFTIPPCHESRKGQPHEEISEKT